jgi:two-component system, NarL family, sensor histidine kinase DesK
MSAVDGQPTNRALKYGWVFAAVWLFYLSGTVVTLWHDDNMFTRYLGFAGVAGFAAMYLFMVSLTRDVRRGIVVPGFTGRATLGVLAMLALFAIQIPGAGDHALSCLVYIAAFGMVGLPLTRGIPLAAALCTLAELLVSLVPGWHDDGYGLAVLLGSIATWGVRMAGERQYRLGFAQQEIADLAVQNERARIAGDLHDILGHSLTVVTVKAELAQRLLDIDIERARKELADLEALARDALSDVRATAMGMRGISLPGEIAAAREALAAANVEADLPGVADEVPSRNRELFAWTIREAVTNIVRHSNATQAQVKLGAGSIEILDNGVGGTVVTGDGQGLKGLRRRADALGAHLTVGCRENEPGFRVRVEVPS